MVDGEKQKAGTDFKADNDNVDGAINNMRFGCHCDCADEMKQLQESRTNSDDKDDSNRVDGTMMISSPSVIRVCSLQQTEIYPIHVSFVFLITFVHRFSPYK